jgi:hypothetical protein
MRLTLYMLRHIQKYMFLQEEHNRALTFLIRVDISDFLALLYALLLSFCLVLFSAFCFAVICSPGEARTLTCRCATAAESNSTPDQSQRAAFSSSNFLTVTEKLYLQEVRQSNPHSSAIAGILQILHALQTSLQLRREENFPEKQVH